MAQFMKDTYLRAWWHEFYPGSSHDRRREPSPTVFMCSWMDLPKACMWPHTQMSKMYISFFSDAVIKHHDHGNLQKKEFLWDQGSREIRLHHRTESWRQGVDIIAGTESWPHTPLKTCSKWPKLSKLQAHLQWHTPSNKFPAPQNYAKQGTKSSNTMGEISHINHHNLAIFFSLFLGSINISLFATSG